MIEGVFHRQPFPGVMAGFTAVGGGWMICRFGFFIRTVAAGSHTGSGNGLIMVKRQYHWKPLSGQVAGLTDIGGGRVTALFVSCRMASGR